MDDGQSCGQRIAYSGGQEIFALRNAAASVFDWWLGEWTFVREIPGYASVRGEARVVAAGEDVARYEETAVVSLVQGGTLRATQSYLYRRPAGPVNGFEVFFCGVGGETGELFERLEFSGRPDGGLEARARFLCAADVYESVFAVDAEGRLLVEHVVHGPKKDYRVQTEYTRIVRGV
jgi:hypothetical protein